MHELYGRNASVQYALKVIRKSEAQGQGMLFNPTEMWQ
jgi:hypothetical protein